MKKRALLSVVAALTLLSTAQAITKQQVITAWKRAGLEVGKTFPMNRQSYGMAPLVGTGMRFLIPSLGEGAGGRVFDVATAKDRQALAGYFNEISKSSAALYSHVFIHKNIVVQINGDLSDARAAQYKKVLLTLK